MRVAFEKVLDGRDVATAAALDVARAAGAEEVLVAALRTPPERRTRRQIRVGHTNTAGYYRARATGWAAWVVRSGVAAGSIDDRRATSQLRMRRAIASAAA